MRGFQLWINLPAREKMKPAAYRDIPSRGIPTVSLGNGGEVRVIAGTLVKGEQRIAGPIQGLSTEPLYLDVHLPSSAHFEAPVTGDHHAFLYLYDGSATVGDNLQALPRSAAGILADGDKSTSRPDRRCVLSPAGRETPTRTDRAARPLRDEHARRDRTGSGRLP